MKRFQALIAAMVVGIYRLGLLAFALVRLLVADSRHALGFLVLALIGMVIGSAIRFQNADQECRQP